MSAGFGAMLADLVSSMVSSAPSVKSILPLCVMMRRRGKAQPSKASIPEESATMSSDKGQNASKVILERLDDNAAEQEE